MSKPIIIAHRGYSRKAPENTLAAFNAAWQEGVDGIEADFHITKDKRIICIHDKNTQRTTGVNRIIKESTLSELKQLDAGSKFKKKFRGEKIPTIEEVLEIIPSGKKIYIEIKCGPEILPYLDTVIKSSNLLSDQFIVMSFNEEFIKQFKEKNPNIKTLLLIDFNNNHLSPNKTLTSKEAVEILQNLKIDGYASKESKDVPLSFIKDICNNDFQYHLWIVDRKRRARKYKNSPVSAIITNTPNRIKKALH